MFGNIVKILQACIGDSAFRYKNFRCSKLMRRHGVLQISCSVFLRAILEKVTEEIDKRVKYPNKISPEYSFYTKVFLSNPERVYIIVKPIHPSLSAEITLLRNIYIKLKQRNKIKLKPRLI